MQEIIFDSHPLNPPSGAPDERAVGNSVRRFFTLIIDRSLQPSQGFADFFCEIQVIQFMNHAADDPAERLDIFYNKITPVKQIGLIGIVSCR